MSEKPIMFPWPPYYTPPYGNPATRDAWAVALLGRFKAMGAYACAVMSLGAAPATDTTWFAAHVRAAGMQVILNYDVHEPGRVSTMKIDAAIHTNSDPLDPHKAYLYCPGYRGAPYATNLSGLAASVAAFLPEYVMVDTEIWPPYTHVTPYVDLTGCTRCLSATGYNTLHAEIVDDIEAACAHSALQGVLFYNTGYAFPPDSGFAQTPALYWFWTSGLSDAVNLLAFKAVVAAATTYTNLPAEWTPLTVLHGYPWITSFANHTAYDTWRYESWVKGITTRAQEDAYYAATGKRILHTPEFWYKMCYALAEAGADGFSLWLGPGSAIVDAAWPQTGDPSQYNYTTYWDERIWELAAVGIQAFREHQSVTIGHRPYLIGRSNRGARMPGLVTLR